MAGKDDPRNGALNGGQLVAGVLQRHRVERLFTLCGGHISPILVGAKELGIRVVDVRDEASAVFAADATARLTGVPGVAAVTAGPGVTNAITAVKNAQLAQTPLVLLGGATATVLEGRGSLQDIDQLSLLASTVKRTFQAESVSAVPEVVEEAFGVATHDVPGPVFVELPVDLLYGEELVREWYGGRRGGGLSGWFLRRYLGWHVNRLFRGAGAATERVEGAGAAPRPPVLEPDERAVRRAARRLASAKRPVLLVGSQALVGAGDADGPVPAERVAAAVRSLALPTWLTGGARGLLGADSPLHRRHKRTRALKKADLVILAGVPTDFRLDYGRSIGRKAKVVAADLSQEEMGRNRKPDQAIHAHPGAFLLDLAEAVEGVGDGEPRRRREWSEELRQRDGEREAEIEAMSLEAAVGDGGGELVNPLALCRSIDAVLPDDSVLVGDGGDFVATASYVVRPRGPLSWLDPGVFGTLGVGGGFALAAKAARPSAEVWLLWGDGSAAYSLAELDTCVRHGLPVIAVVGNDAGWTQIAREQVEVLEDDVGTVLARNDYHRVAEGYGAAGLLVERPDQVDDALAEAQRIAAAGTPVLINVHLGPSDFRKGSISM